VDVGLEYPSNQPSLVILSEMTHMTDDLVHTRTNTLWESIVIQRTRIRIPINTSLMTDCVELVRSDSRFDMSSRQVQNLPSELYISSCLVSIMRTERLTLQTFLIPSISSFVKILTLLSLTASHWENP
jgi:hypothetical protein